MEIQYVQDSFFICLTSISRMLSMFQQLSLLLKDEHNISLSLWSHRLMGGKVGKERNK